MEKTAASLNRTTSNSTSAKDIIHSILAPTGIKINGSQPWDIQIHNDKFYDRILQYGALGLGESYMDQWWDCQKLDVLFDKILSAHLDREVDISWSFKIKHLLARVMNFQTKERAKQVAYKHYDLGNDLFIQMLDPQMIYSCAYYKDTNNLNDAQTAKLKLICEKLQLKPGMRVLDIGCGWGGLAKYAAQHYGVQVVGVTISQQQAAYAKENCRALPVDIRLCDYRDINETFDRIVSVGMFEHVGYMNYDVYMQTVHRCLTADGLFLLHTIGGNQTALFANEWITKYIFPNGMLPSMKQIGEYTEKYFVMEDWHNFGPYYDKTLLAWHENFTRNWHNIKDQYDERFYRMWNYYLLSCAGNFRARGNQLWQILFSKNGIRGEFTVAR